MKTPHWVLLFVLLFPVCSYAQSKDWRIVYDLPHTRMDISDATLYSLHDDTLTYIYNRAMQNVPVDSVISLSRRTGEGNYVRNVLAGALGLGATGYLIGQVLGKDEEKKSGYYYSSSETETPAVEVALPIVGLVAGAGIGALLTTKGKEEFYPVGQMIPTQKRSLIASLIPAQGSVAQRKETDDMVYLKNGSIIRGRISEMIPDSVLKVSTAEGSLFVFKMSEVARVAKSDTAASDSPKQSVARSNSAPIMRKDDGNQVAELSDVAFSSRARFTVRAGASIPTGDFADDISGGFALSGDVSFPRDEYSSWGFNLTVAFNSVDVSSIPSNVNVDVGSFTSVWPMVAFGVQTASNSSVDFFLQPRIGLVIATNPEATLSQGTIRVTQQSATGTAFAFGVCGGLLISNRFRIEGTFMTGKPEFEITASSSGSTVTGKGKASVSVFVASVGYTL